MVMAAKFVGVFLLLTINLTEGIVLLDSTLFDGDTAYEEQNVDFTCTTKGHEDFLTWSSDDYLDQPLQISFHDVPGQPEFSPQNPTTIATLVNATMNGDTEVIVSRLQIIASSDQNSISSVSCQTGNDGEMNTTTFRVSPPTAQLFATLIDEYLALEMEQINFTCTTISHEDFLTWSSDDYIDQPLQISFHDVPGQPEFSPQNPTTVATLVNAITNGGVIVIVSQLQIIASINQNPISNISCQISSRGPVATLQFQAIKQLPIIPSVTTEPESNDDFISSTNIGTDSPDDDLRRTLSIVIPTVFGVCAVIIVAGIGIFLGVRYRKRRANGRDMQS